MMIAALIQGELIADPVPRETAKGVPFATATVRVPAGAEALFIGVAAFDATAAERLAKLHKGASIAAAGTLEATEWQTRDGGARKGWRLTATEVLSVYSARKRRDAEAGE
jgi:single-stranded DNA-binding protein